MVLLSLLLQVDTAAQAAAGLPPAEPEKISLLGLLMEGGVLMIPLLLCSILLVYVFIERLMVIRKASNVDPMFMSRIREQVTGGNLQGAKSLTRGVDNPVAKM